MLSPIQNIHVATDAVILTIRSGKLQVLLIQMIREPFAGRWALPGGLLDTDETSQACAERILRTHTGVTGAYLEQLGTFDGPGRDPRSRTVSIAYFALMESKNTVLQVSSKYSNVAWWPVDSLPDLGYDHADIVRVALDRIRAKLEYTTVAWGLLPREFTLSQLQETYEAVLGKPLDTRNFRKKVLDTAILRETGAEQRGGAHRPAKLYAFRDRAVVFANMV